MLIYHLMIKLCKYFNLPDDDISECYKNKLKNSIKRINKIKKFFEYHNLDNSKEFIYWKQKLLDEIKN
nr:MAG TPA: deoxyuridine 5'-triphosphate nucleotidohydrolase [Crassvirales sp.]